MATQQLATNELLGGVRRRPAIPATSQPMPYQTLQIQSLGGPKSVNPSGLSACPPQGIHILSQAENSVNITKKERDEILTETAKKEAELPLLTIVKSNISLYSWEEMQKIAGPIRVTNLLFQGNGSVNDPRMGVVSLNNPCQYCSQIDCPGHYGLIEFRVPIYNPAYIREVVSVLTCVCNDCGGLLITEDVMRQKGFMSMSYDKRLSAMESHCKDLICLRQKPQIGGGALVPCSKNHQYITAEIKDKGEITYKEAKGSDKNAKDDIIKLMSIVDVINILDRISPYDSYLLGFPAYHRGLSQDGVLKILDKVPAADAIKYGIKVEQKGHRQRPYQEVIAVLDKLSEEVLRKLGFPQCEHPRNMIMRGCLVPPVIARPPVYEGGSIHHDQLTHMYVTIMRKVMDISMNKEGAVGELYTAVKQLIFKTDGKKMGMRDFLSIVERIQGKNALLRGLLMGKRVNYCGRTVAGPDPSLRFGQLRLPEAWAPVLTKKIPVTNYNIHNLTALLEAGRITHITPKKTGLRKFYDNRYRYRLQIGDQVERWMQTGDRVVNNRQPTLHRQSMMSYEVVLGKESTVGLHLSYTTPTNCDFDGDENNAWSPQDFEVEAESEIIMNVKNNIMSSEQNKPIMGLVMNSVSGAYLLSKPDVRINDDLFAELLSLITNQGPIKTLYQRLMKYGVHPRSGQAIFSAMLPEDFYYNQKGVLILEGILISGRLKKSHVGTSHRSIIQELYKNYGPQRTSDFFSDAPWVINKWLIERGFSVGMLDMINLDIDPVTGKEYDKNKRILEQELAKIYVQLEALGGKLKDPIEETYRQRQINNLVNIAQGIGLRLAKDALSGDNSVGVMTDQGAGTKGGIANIGQMFGAVGQQYYRGERLKPTITGGKRLLPTYDEDDNNPEANAFIPDSFFTGISPEALFFLQAGGREGILDTALKTAETGTMSHRMVKAFENIIIAYDGSIRNTIGTMFSPMYNSGYDIGEMMAVESLGKPDFSSFIDIKSVVAELNIKRGWIPKDINKSIVENRQKIQYTTDNILQMPPPNYVKGPALTNTKVDYDIKAQVPRQATVMKLTRFEKARIIGTRATQLANNAPPLVDIGEEVDPIKIALKEYEAGVLQLYIIRKYPDGSYQIVRPTKDNI